MSFTLERGAAFRLPSGPNADLHLHIVVTEECADGMHLLIPISSKKGRKSDDATCPILSGEHKRITKASFAYYQFATTMSANHIERMIRKKYFRADEPVTDALLERICKGIAQTKRIPRGMRTYYEKNGD